MPAPARDQRVEVLLQRSVEPRDSFARRGAEGERNDGVAAKRTSNPALRRAGLGREGFGADSADCEGNVAAVEDDAVAVDAGRECARHAVELRAAVDDEPRVLGAGVRHAAEQDGLELVHEIVELDVALHA